MRKNTTKITVLVLFIILLLAACGGQAGPDIGGPVDFAPSDTAVQSAAVQPSQEVVQQPANEVDNFVNALTVADTDNQVTAVDGNQPGGGEAFATTTDQTGLMLAGRPAVDFAYAGEQAFWDTAVGDPVGGVFTEYFRLYTPPNGVGGGKIDTGWLPVTMYGHVAGIADGNMGGVPIRLIRFTFPAPEQGDGLCYEFTVNGVTEFTSCAPEQTAVIEQMMAGGGNGGN